MPVRKRHEVAGLTGNHSKSSACNRDDDPNHTVWASVLPFVHFIRIIRPILIAAAMLGLTGCGEPRDRLFLGQVTPTSGMCGLSAAARSVMQGTLSIRDGVVLFAPETGVIALPGRIDALGHIVAGQTVAGADHKPFAMAFEGELKGKSVTGTYATPRCRAGVSLSQTG